MKNLPGVFTQPRRAADYCNLHETEYRALLPLEQRPSYVSNVAGY